MFILAEFGSGQALWSIFLFLMWVWLVISSGVIDATEYQQLKSRLVFG
jgi:hypothetical protein